MQTIGWENVNVSQDKREAWLVTALSGPHLLCEAGVFSLWKLVQLLGNAKHAALVQGLLDYPDIVAAHCDLLTLTVRCCCHPELARIHLQDRLPVKVTVEVQSLGKTSVTLVSRVLKTSSLHSDTVLVTSRTVLVNISRRSGRPVPLPATALEPVELEGTGKGRQTGSGVSEQFSAGFDEIPVSADNYDVTVVSSDTIAGHTNEASYVRYCFGGANNTRRHHPVSKSASAFKQLEVQYCGQSMTGDRLKVLSWQRPSFPDTTCYVIKRLFGIGDDVIVRAVGTYHEQNRVPMSSL
ncbi:uncharacterized protein [Littorina saxatilis]|uniref:uncharacterized protein n=1 Tax=Littorina saxatilis TaxID=31220 RepID=UPI0038B4C417